MWEYGFRTSEHRQLGWLKKDIKGWQPKNKQDIWHSVKID